MERMPRKNLPPRKPPAKASPPAALYIGAHVRLPGSDSVWEITRVSHDRCQVDLCLRGTNLERFRVPVSELIAVA
jgi:hypothetical protein